MTTVRWDGDEFVPSTAMLKWTITIDRWQEKMARLAGGREDVSKTPAHQFCGGKKRRACCHILTPHSFTMADTFLTKVTPATSEPLPRKFKKGGKIAGKTLEQWRRTLGD